MVLKHALSKNRAVTLITAVALGLGIGWTLGAQDAKPQKQWKDQQEYQMANDANKENDAQKRLPLIDKWKQAYPQSDYADVRDNLYLITFQQTGTANCRRAIDFDAEILKTRPNDYLALTGIVSCMYQTNVQPADMDIGEKTSKYLLDNLDAVFAMGNNPPTMTPEQFQQAKPSVKAFAQRTLGYIAMQKKDHPRAEAELIKGLQLDPTQTQFAYFTGSEILAQQKEHPEKQPQALFYFARAAAYDGPNAMPAAQRRTTNDFLARAYKTYHCSDQGLDQLLATAKTTPFPPEGFNIVDCGTIKQKEAEAEEARRQANPMMTVWTDVKKELTGDNGPSYFEMNMKDSAFPPMTGKIISMTPATRPKEIVLGVEKPDVGDTTLKFEAALPGTMEKGEELKFEGVPQSYSKDPYMIVFSVDKDKLTGWTGKNTPAKGAPKGKAAPAPAKKQ